jgi:D-alanyl-D-alanine carboxypeptidase (penicillin-binding protein 5/6)
MASTTKIMTALVAIEQGNLADVVAIDPSCVGIEGSSAYLEAGEKLTLEDLLYALMLVSGNDAAEAIALHVGGNRQNFIVQ